MYGISTIAQHIFDDDSILNYSQDPDRSESPASRKPKGLSAQEDENGSDDGSHTAELPVNDTVDNDELIEEQDGGTAEPSAEHKDETENHLEKSTLPVLSFGDEPFTMAEEKIIHGFLHFMKRDRLGLSNLMNTYLDFMDAPLDCNDFDIAKPSKGLMAMHMGSGS
ncbi:hypothetical protein MFRU_010g02540 [Monilinia fructicola]|nr:hypothetical protein MFRU_010g02540 [Monilinia fructicola]